MKRKILLVFFIVILLIGIWLPYSYAEGGDETDYLGVVKSEIQEPTGSDKVTSIAQIVYSVFQIVAAAVLIIYAIILAIKYMNSAPGDRAAIKQHAIIFVVGAVLIFGATNIIGIIIDFTDDSFGSGTSTGTPGIVSGYEE